MSSAALSQLLLLYSWFVLVGLVLLLLLIARFYERFSGETTRFRLFLAPVVLYGAAAVRYAGIDQVGGDPVGDLLLGLAGLSLAVLCVMLVVRMTAGRTAP